MVFYPKNLIGKSKPLENILTFIEEAARTDYPVLLLGETGVGKELTARLIHKRSRRKQKAFIPINITTIPETLLESELFGHKKGAFTDATEDRPGILKVADGGTLFLDEITECLSSVQVRLLRVIDTGEIKTVGEDHLRRVDIRFISATNKKIEDEIGAGRLRKDFYYRISILRLLIPPLRNRKEDIPLLIEHIIQTVSEGKKKKMSEKALTKLLAYSFPGNIRELENIIIRSICHARGQEIREQDIIIESIEKDVIMTKAEKLFWDMRRGGKTFWEVVYKPFLGRDLERNTVREVIAMGLRESGGCYKKVMPLFNMREVEKDYKRFMKMLSYYRLKR